MRRRAGFALVPEPESGSEIPDQLLVVLRDLSRDALEVERLEDVAQKALEECRQREDVLGSIEQQEMQHPIHGRRDAVEEDDPDKASSVPDLPEEVLGVGQPLRCFDSDDIRLHRVAEEAGMLGEVVQEFPVLLGTSLPVVGEDEETTAHRVRIGEANS